MIEEIRSFRASDGKLFDSENDALAYQYVLDIEPAFIEFLDERGANVKSKFASAVINVFRDWEFSRRLIALRKDSEAQHADKSGGTEETI